MFVVVIHRAHMANSIPPVRETCVHGYPSGHMWAVIANNAACEVGFAKPLPAAPIKSGVRKCLVNLEISEDLSLNFTSYL